MRVGRMMRQWLGGVVVLAVFVASVQAEPLIENGQTIAFLGDSITRDGAASQGGYARLVVSGLAVNGIRTEAVYAGVGGHKSNQMLARLQRDVLDKKPHVMTLSCGVNDVWHGERGVPLEDYRKNITAIVDQAEAAGVKVVLLTATMIGEDPDNENNRKLEAYNDFLRELAAQRKLPLADLNADMRAAVQAANQASSHKGNKLTTDGVHMNLRGNLMMAVGVLRALGLNDEQMERARQHWLERAGVGDLRLRIPLSLRKYEALIPVAEANGQSVEDYVVAEIQRLIDEKTSKP